MRKQALILAVIAVLVGLVALTPIVFSAPGAAQTSFDIQYDEASAGADGPSPFTEDFKIKTTDETRFAFGPDAARSIRIRRANAEGNVTLRPRSNETTYDVEAIELNAGDIIEAREAAQDGVDRSPEIELTAFDSTGDRISPDMNVSVAGDLALFRDNAVDPYVLEVIGADGSVVASTDAEPHAVRYTASIEYNGSALAVTRAPSVDEEWYVGLEQDIDGDERDETVLEFDHGNGDAFFTAETADTEFNASREFDVDIYANESDELGERIGGLFSLRISDENRVSGPVGDDGPNDTGGSDEADSLETSVSPASIPAGETTEVTVSVSTEAGVPVEDATVEIPALALPATTGADGNVTLTLSPSFPEELPVSISAADYADTTETLTVETAEPDNGGTAALEDDVDTGDLAGNGTEDDPYEISNVSELQAMEDDLDANYTLVSDIDASQTAQFSNGSGFDPIGDADAFDETEEEFNGSFDGNRQTISGLTIDRPGEGNIGLFGALDSGTVTDVSLRGVTITGDFEVGGLTGTARGNSIIKNVSVSGSISQTVFDSGGLVGSAEDNTTMQNVTASVDVTDDGGDSNAGGLVGGLTDNSVIQNATASGNVSGSDAVGGLVGGNRGTIQNATASGSVTAAGDRAANVGGLVGANDGMVQTSTASGNTVASSADNVGGLVGENNGGTIRNAAVSGSVDGNRTVGGAVGRNNNGTIQETFSVGPVSGNTDTGGLVGNNSGFSGTGTVTESYWDTEATGQSDSAGNAIGLTTAEMQGQAAATNMNGLDFESMWTSTESYPTLQNLPELPDQDGDVSVASIVAPPDTSYTPSDSFTIGTAHDATGAINNGDVAIRLVNVTAENGTVVAINDDIPVAGDANTTVPADQLTGNVTIETQLYNTSNNAVEATGMVNLTTKTNDAGAGQGSAPEDPTQRALQITGKNDVGELTQNDVTVVITRFNRGQSFNSVDITQDDVTATITLFERN